MKKLITLKMAPTAKRVMKMKNASLISLSITMLFDGEYRRFFNTADGNLEKVTNDIEKKILPLSCHLKVIPLTTHVESLGNQECQPVTGWHRPPPSDSRRRRPGSSNPTGHRRHQQSLPCQPFGLDQVI